MTVTAIVIACYIFASKFSTYVLQIFLSGLLPFFFLGVFSTYILPAITRKFLNYPLLIEDKSYEDNEDEDKFLVEQDLMLQEL